MENPNEDASRPNSEASSRSTSVEVKTTSKDSKGLLARARERIASTIQKVMPNRRERISLEEVIPKKSPSYDLFKQRADEAIHRWEKDPPLEDSVLDKVASEEKSGSQIDPNDELAIRLKEAEELAKEEGVLRRDLELVTGVLDRMQQLNEEATKLEEERKKKLIQEHEDYQREHAAMIVDLEEKQAELQKQIDKYDEKMRVLEQEINEDNKKRDQVATAIRSVMKDVSNVSDELESCSHTFRKNLKQYESKVGRRREEDLKDLAKYQESKNTLEENLSERLVVRKALEGRDVSEVPGVRREPAPSLEGHDHVSLEERLQQALDWRNNRKAAVAEMQTSSGAKELKSEAVLAEAEGFIISSQVIKNQKICVQYKAKTALTVYGSKELSAKVFLWKDINERVEKHLYGHTFKILRFVANHSFRNLPEIFDTFVIKKQKVIIFEEPLKTDLEQYRKDERTLNEREIKPLAESLASAVNYLHNIGVAHQNISPNNIFIDQYGTLKLGSLEWCIIYWNLEKEAVDLQQAKGSYQTCSYLAPEVIEGLEYDPTLADVYSYGCMVVYMATGLYPKDNRPNVNSEAHERAVNLELQKKFSKQARELIFGCVQPEPANRLTIRDAVVHPWFSESL